MVGITIIVRLDIRVIVVRIVVVGVIGVEIPRIKSVVQTDPEGTVPAPPVTVPVMCMASVPMLGLKGWMRGQIFFNSLDQLWNTDRLRKKWMPLNAEASPCLSFRN